IHAFAVALNLLHSSGKISLVFGEVDHAIFIRVPFFLFGQQGFRHLVRVEHAVVVLVGTAEHALGERVGPATAPVPSASPAPAPTESAATKAAPTKPPAALPLDRHAARPEVDCRGRRRGRRSATAWYRTRSRRCAGCAHSAKTAALHPLHRLTGAFGKLL